MTPHPLHDAVVGHLLSVHEKPWITMCVYTELPPVSINKLYTSWNGKRILTAAGKAFRDGLARAVSMSTPTWKNGLDAVYQEGRGATLLVGLYIESLYNASWLPGQRTGSGELQQPFKVQDSGNYIKIIEDAVKKGCGIDDCNNLNHLVYKCEDKLRPRTEVTYIIA